MGQYLRVNGDYNIETPEGANIVLDTGPGTGNVRVTGNLIVQGDTLTVSAQNLNVDDNVIILNNGETGAGVTLDYSGIQVDRGLLPDVSLVWNELIDSWQLVSGDEGNYDFANSVLKLNKILTDDATLDWLGRPGTLTLIDSGAGVVSIGAQIAASVYASRVIDDNDIPNKLFVETAVQNFPNFQITRDNSRVIVFDLNDPLTSFPQGPYSAQPPQSLAGVVVENQVVATFFNDRAVIGQPGVNGIEIDGINFEIRTESSVTDQNILIRTAGTGKLEINNAIQLNKKGTIPSPIPVSGNTVLYAANADLGGTGLWHITDDLDPNKQVGELVNKNRALLFSMIF